MEEVVVNIIIDKRRNANYTIQQVIINPIANFSQLKIDKIKLLFQDLQLNISSNISIPERYRFRLVIYNGRDFYAKSRVSDDTNFLFNQKRLSIKQDSADDANTLMPIIHITTANLLCNNSYLPDFPRYALVMDSSIWNYYYCFEYCYKDNKKERLKKIISDIVQNYNNGLYNFAITHEYADFYARLTKESYIIDSKGHGQYISPFVFHSEYEIYQELNSLLTAPKDSSKNSNACFNNISSDYCLNQKWRILLIDDYATRPLRNIGEISPKMHLQATQKCIGKLKVIIDDLKTRVKPYKEYKSEVMPNIVWCKPKIDRSSLWEWKDIDNKPLTKYSNPDITIVCAENIKEAFYLLTIQKYDIILLDYLLDWNYNHSEREYSYYLLKIIGYLYYNDKKSVSLCNRFGIALQDEHNKDGYKIKLNGKDFNVNNLIGPNNRLFFMHISAFVSAIQERLQEQRLLRNEPFWFIARGACPTNTPELFLYYLYRTMKKRYESIMKQEDKTVGTLIKLLNDIYNQSEKDKDIRRESLKKFNVLLNLRAIYNRVKKDIDPKEYDILKMDIGTNITSEKSPLDCKSSRLIYSLFPDIECYSNSFWEHIQHLVYLTAFGTIRQWPEMWEEYMFVKERLIKAEMLCGYNTEKEYVSKCIENYIISLKKL